MATYSRDAFRTLWADAKLPPESNYRWQDLLMSLVFFVDGDDRYIQQPSSPEQGDVLYYNGTTWTRLVHGTSGQALLSGGHGANPSWGAAGVTDHDDLTGLTDDDHTQYLDTAGARTWTMVLTTTDGQYRGVTISGTAGENVTYGDLTYLKSDGKFWMTDADSTATAGGYLLALVATATVAADATGTFLLFGTMCETDWAWTVGSPLFVSTAAGDMTHTKPSGNADVVQPVGYAYHADSVYFNPSRHWITIVA